MISINIENIKTNLVHIRDLIEDHSPHVIWIQEHWLFKFEQNFLSEVHPKYDFAVKSVDENDPIAPHQRPRGYQGVAILWDKKLPVIKHTVGPEWIQAITIGEDICILNAYLPCRGSYTDDEFCCEVDKMTHVCNQFAGMHILLAGDLNVDLLKHSGRRVLHLKDFLNTQSFKEAQHCPEPTFENSEGHTSKIDYIMSNRRHESN